MEVEMIHSPYDQSEAPYLANDFIRRLGQNPSLIKILTRILSEFEEFTIHKVNGVEEIKQLKFSKDHNTLIYNLDVPDQVSGVLKPQIVIKKLRHYQHSYEIRINQEHYKYRFLYQFNKKHLDDENLIFLSYGFSKTQFNGDLTNTLSNSNDEIKKEIIESKYDEQILRKWVSVN